MDDARRSAREIIEAFGGTSAFARALGIEHRRSAVANWAKDGIPAKYWPAIARLAESASGAEWVTLDALEHHSTPRREEAA